MNIRKTVVALLLLAGLPAGAGEDGRVLTLEEAVALGVASDPWLSGSRYRQTALADEAVAAAALPDPELSLAAGNFPVDSFDINQEAMTQVSVGVSQMFPRGDSLALARQEKEQLSAREPFLRRDRKAQVAATVSRLWLEVYRSQQTIRLIEADRALFDYLVDAARSSYASAVGRARQQDLVRAQLELTRLEDRLTVLRQRRESAQRQLSEWVGESAALPLDAGLPPPAMPFPAATLRAGTGGAQSAYERIAGHPALAAIDRRIEAMDTAVDLARQKYKPEWGVNARYGYRAEDTAGQDRDDLFSVGVTFDLPLFTANRQDREVSAAVARAGALKTDRQLLARRLVAELDAALTDLRRLEERETLYTQRLLPQMAAQAEAALTAYNNDDGDFAEAVRARIDELDARIDALSLAVDRRQVLARLDYLLAGAGDDPAATSD